MNRPGAAPGDPPLVDDLRAYYEREDASFHMPGHKQRLAGLHPLVADVLGERAIRADVSEMGGFDYLHSPDGALADAQRRAAEVFGARHTFFLVNGSTVGNLAAIAAFADDDSCVAMLRGSHRSVYAAVALAGARPHYVPMHHDIDDDGWFLATPPTPGAPPGDVSVVHVTRPNYYGMACDLAPYVSLARDNDALLVVDEAHGSHFGLHPALPSSALAEGADMVIQSTHKTLGALTQASMLHVGTDRVDVDRLARSLQMLQSSSPSALLSLSLDLATDHVATSGASLLGRVIALVDTTAVAIDSINGLRRLRNRPGATTDPTKLVIDVTGLAMTGFDAARFLKEHCRVNVELADHRRIVCSLTIGDDDATAHVLAASLRTLAAARRTSSGTTPPSTAMPPIPTMDATPRRALAALSTMTPVGECVDRMCAEYVIPYPPGIPLVVPGERLTADVLAAIEQYRGAGSRIVGPADPSGGRLAVAAVSG